MKIVHMFEHAPMFEMTKEEREVAISALKTYLAKYPENGIARAMLNNIEQIDLALEAMARVAKLEQS